MRALCERMTDRHFASYFPGAPMRSLVRPSNVSPVFVDYPRYLHLLEGGTALSLSCSPHGVQLQQELLTKLCLVHRTTQGRFEDLFDLVFLRTTNTAMHLFALGSSMTAFSFPLSLFLAPLLLNALRVSGSPSPRCASCGAPSLERDAEERLMTEIAKQQILEKLNLKERPNITHTVPRAALLTALRKLHAGRVRQDGTLELENEIPTKDPGYEIVSFADISKFDIHLLLCKAVFFPLGYLMFFLCSLQYTVETVSTYSICHQCIDLNSGK